MAASSEPTHSDGQNADAPDLGGVAERPAAFSSVWHDIVVPALDQVDAMRRERDAAIIAKQDAQAGAS